MLTKEELQIFQQRTLELEKEEHELELQLTQKYNDLSQTRQQQFKSFIENHITSQVEEVGIYTQLLSFKDNNIPELIDDKKKDNFDYLFILYECNHSIHPTPIVLNNDLEVLNHFIENHLQSD